MSIIKITIDPPGTVLNAAGFPILQVQAGDNHPVQTKIIPNVKGIKGDRGESGESKRDLFIPGNEQTAFMLSESPATGIMVKMIVNGVRIYSFTVSGIRITYTGTSYKLGPTDLVEFNY